MNRKILLVIDMQFDFCHPEGSLYIKDAEKLIIPIDKEMKSKKYDQIWATQDWHPKNHISFASNHKDKKPFDVIKAPNGEDQILWADHCIGEMFDGGANFVFIIESIEEFKEKYGDLECFNEYFEKYFNEYAKNTESMCYGIDDELFNLIFRKGMNPEIDSYSAFYDNAGNPTGLGNMLQYGDKLYVCGVAGDYCVKYTCLDAIKIARERDLTGFEVIFMEDLTAFVDPSSEENAIQKLKEVGYSLCNCSCY